MLECCRRSLYPELDCPNMYIVENTLDDVLNRVLSKLLISKNRISPGRGPATEIVGALIRIRNPRARLSRTEKRGKIFSSLGELLWYLAKSKRLDFIEYYIPAYKCESENGVTIAGAYGPRLFAKDSINQVDRILRQLRDKKDTRNAVIQLFDARDLNGDVTNIPCTCTLQFFSRGGHLHMVTHMRSNDAYLGLPHDVFCFTMIQEIFATSLSLKLGTYSHAVGSLHLYDDDRSKARQVLDEGWQSTFTMPNMPTHHVWESISQLLKIEKKLRTGEAVALDGFDLEPYWLDLARLLQVYRASMDNHSQRSRIRSLRKQMTSKVYDPYIVGRLNVLPRHKPRI